MLRPSWTLSYWLTWLSVALALNERTRKAGGWGFLIVGIGGLGACHERASGCNLRNYPLAFREAKLRAPVVSAARHIPQLVIGAWVVSR